MLVHLRLNKYIAKTTQAGPLSTAPSQPCTSSSAPSSPHGRHLSCSPGLCTPRLGWPSHRPPVPVNARQLSLVFAVQSAACRSCRRRCCWTPCCFRVCEGRERIHERLSEVSAGKVRCVQSPSEITQSERVTQIVVSDNKRNWDFFFSLVTFTSLKRRNYNIILRKYKMINRREGYIVVCLSVFRNSFRSEMKRYGNLLQLI